MPGYRLGPRSKSRHPADDRTGGAEDPYGDPKPSQRSHMTRRKPITFLATAAVVPLTALAVAGCGGGGSNNASSSAPPKASPPPAARHAHKSSPAPARHSHKSSPAPAAPSTPKPSPKPAAPPAQKSPPKPPPKSNGIPQNNGGDGDADNNGGPDDGDGGI
jgi:hypothetical protein